MLADSATNSPLQEIPLTHIITSDPLSVDPATDHVRGSSQARVTLVEYGDFECPACRQANRALEILVANFADRLRFVFRQYPLREVHLHAELAAEASEAAAAQGLFWPFHAKLFASNVPLDGRYLRRCAEEVGLDLEKFDLALQDHRYIERVQEQIDSGDRVGVRSTPTFFVDGVMVDASFGMSRLDTAVHFAVAGLSGKL